MLLFWIRKHNSGEEGWISRQSFHYQFQTSTWNYSAEEKEDSTSSPGPSQYYKPFSSPELRGFFKCCDVNKRNEGSGNENDYINCNTSSAVTPQYGHYLTHAHSQITRAVETMDSWFGLVRPKTSIKSNKQLAEAQLNSVVRMLFRGIWSVFSHFCVLTCERAKTIRTRYVRTEKVWKTKINVYVFKRKWIRVDGASPP